MAFRPTEAQLHELLSEGHEHGGLHAYLYAGRLAALALATLAPTRCEHGEPAGIGTDVGQDHDIEADVAVIEAAPPAQRATLVESFLARYSLLWKAAARKYGRQCHVRHEDMEDAVQVVRLTAYEMLTDGSPPDGVGWLSAFWVRSASAIRAWSASGEVTGLAGMSGHMRRHRSLAKLKNERPDLEGDALVGAWNAAAAERRSDPRRQGAVATTEDLVEHHVVVGDPAEWSAGYEDLGFERLVGDSVNAEVLELIGDACRREISELAGAVARIWLQSALDDEPMSCAEIGRRTGVSRTTVLRLIAPVKRVARQVLVDYLEKSLT